MSGGDLGPDRSLPGSLVAYVPQADALATRLNRI
jgi:hypothetical protein